jgi:hypothetical protein
LLGCLEAAKVNRIEANNTGGQKQPMKSRDCSICECTALAVAISAFALIALFWAVVLMIVLIGEGPSMSATASGATAIASSLKITDVIGVFIAFCALLVAVGSLLISLRHHRLSVRPKISIVRVIENNDNHKKGLYLRNHGLGPALITGIKIELKSKKTVIRCYEDLKNLFSLYTFQRNDLGTYWLEVLPKDACERLI